MDEGAAFRQLRVQARLTQAEAGRLFGVTLSTVQSWEYGLKHISKRRLPKILAVFEVYERHRLAIEEELAALAA